MVKKALVFGVTGQDGSYLAEILLAKDYEVYGVIRRSATGNTKNIDHLISNKEIFNSRFFLSRGDLTDNLSIFRIINEIQPDEIYNEADQDHVGWSYDMVNYSLTVTGVAVGSILEAIYQINPEIRYFQPCSSNMFGLVDDELQNESTPFNPQSPYACAKVMAYFLTKYYREAFGIFASTAIFYNHESPRRPVEYVTRKISQSAAKIALGKQNKLVLGDLSARIDWGYAKEYMEAAWQILQLENADDFIIATGEAHSVEEFVNETFKVLGLDVEKYVSSSSEFFRPTKTSTLIGDFTKANVAFGFDPQVKFKQLVKLMVDSDLQAERN